MRPGLPKQRPRKGLQQSAGANPNIDVDAATKEIMEMAGSAEDDNAQDSLAQLELRTFLRGTKHDHFMQWLISAGNWKRIAKGGAKINASEIKAALAEFHKGDKGNVKKEATTSQLNAGRIAVAEEQKKDEAVQLQRNSSSDAVDGQKEESKRVLRRSPRVGGRSATTNSLPDARTSGEDTGSPAVDIVGAKTLTRSATAPIPEVPVKKAPELTPSLMSELYEGHKKKRVEYSFMLEPESVSTGCVALEDQDTIGKLKQRIEENQGIRVDRQLMSIGPVQLEDSDVPMGAKSRLFMTDYTYLAAEKVCRIIPAEKRGIRVDQLGKLREFTKNYRAKDRTFCGWCDMDIHSETYGKPLRYSTFDVYQLQQWIVHPFTKRSGVSYVEMIAEDANSQDAQWFLACHFAEPIVGLSSCVDAHSKARGLPETAAYWICAFSCSQYELDHSRRAHLGYMTEQPFYRALKHCKGLLFVADSSERAFSRVWCCFELSLHLCFKSKRRLLDIATDFKNKSYVITDGLVEAEQKKVAASEPIAGWSKKTKREIDFPMWTLAQALDMDIEAGVTSEPSDKTAILDFMKNDWDGGLPMDQLNMKIRIWFSHICWRGAVITNLKDNAIREKLVKTIACDTERKSVSSFLCGTPTLQHEHIAELADTLPPGLEKLVVDCTGCKQLTDSSLTTLVNALPKSVTSLDISFCGIDNITDACLLQVCEKLPSKLSRLRFTARSCWKISNEGVDSLTKALEKSSIKELELDFRGCTKIRDDCATKLLFGIPPTVASFKLDFSNTSVSPELLGAMTSLEEIRLFKIRWTEADKLAKAEAARAAAAAQKVAYDKQLAQDMKELEGLVEKFKKDPKGMTLKEKVRLKELQQIQKKHQKEEYRKAIRKSPRSPGKGTSTPGRTDSGSESEKYYSKERRDTIHGSGMKHAPVSPHSTMSFWKTPAPKETDDDIQLYFRWCAGRVSTIHDIFKQYDVSGQYCGFRNVTAREFVEHILWHGFEGNALNVFEAIQLENSGLTRHVEVAGDGEFGEISLSQLTRFERRHPDLGRGAETAVVRFVKKLRKSRGCLLRAWRMDMDLRGSGLVAQADFVRACRRVGFSSEIKELWSAFRPGGGTAPLEFREFDGPEAMNLDRFTEALWNSVDFDLNKAWCCLDPHNRGVSTLEEFRNGARLLGFEGNAALLFKGLDTSGLGKLKRHEMRYLQVLQTNAAKTDYIAPPIRALGKWVHAVLGSPSALIAKLGLHDTGNVSMSADDFNTQMIRLGYRGDAKRASSLIAQFGRNERINAEMIYSLLADTVGHTSSPHANTSRVCKASPPSVSPTTTPMHQKEWQGTIIDVSKYNLQSPPGSRAYFSTPDGGTHTLLHPRNLPHRPGITLGDLGYTYTSHLQDEDEQSDSTILEPRGEDEDYYREEEEEQVEDESGNRPLPLTEEAIKRHESIPEFRAPPRTIVGTTDATRTASSPQLDYQYMMRHSAR